MGPLNQFVGGKDGLGPRGGTLCFGDSDLRPIYDRQSPGGLKRFGFRNFEEKLRVPCFPCIFLYVIYKL